MEAVYGREAVAPLEAGHGEENQGIRMVTAAPEIVGVMHAIKVMRERGIIVSIGHMYLICCVSLPRCIVDVVL